MAFVRGSIKLIFGLAVIFALFFSFLPTNINNVFIKPLQAEMASVPEDIDLGIVLGAGLLPDGSLTDLAKERVDYAVEIFSDTNIPLMFAGGFAKYGIEAEAMNDYARTIGYDEQGLLEDKSTSTYENALFSDQIIDDGRYEINFIIVITSSFHSRRALATFKKVMPERTIHVAYPPEVALFNDTLRGRWSGLYMIVREYVALAGYRVKWGIK